MPSNPRALLRVCRVYLFSATQTWIEIDRPRTTVTSVYLNSPKLLPLLEASLKSTKKMINISLKTTPFCRELVNFLPDKTTKECPNSRRFLEHKPILNTKALGNPGQGGVIVPHRSLIFSSQHNRTGYLNCLINFRALRAVVWATF